MWLIVGLGNPGKNYEKTRHNIGFRMADKLLELIGNPPAKNQFKAEVYQGNLDGNPLILCKPQTFMNLSGESVQPLLGYYKIPKENLLVYQDDLDIPFGQLRLHKNRGHGGHNGIRSISQQLGSADYHRFKMGIGRPPHPEFPIEKWVLSAWNTEEDLEMNGFLEKTIEATKILLKEGSAKTASLFNK